MYYNKELLLSMVKEVKKGDVVKITYCFDGKLGDFYNKILIIEDKGGFKAVWYDDEDYKGRGYVITDYQVITEIVKRDVDVDEYFRTTEIKRINEAKLDTIFVRKED